ncbi:hypothetical protein [Amycolatopsis sp. MtRt-6]|uniref:hypothetical protein n=1 Tax=Amycolatopsis sp. MtRt-6 TaxID=2792782 RepID=UPI001A8DC8A3|nr:hypothetical protein [Amycolatopsis sp. MtRt-6]
MARDHARIDVHIWNDEDFQQLSLLAKMLYVQLVSQPKLSYAGVLDLAVKRWSRPHADVDITALRAALDELDAARFVVIDHDTEELLIRTFIRNDELYKQPNVLRAALRVAFEIESPVLRAALAAELRQLPADVTGPAPAFAAAALEAGARELPGEVKAAMSIRGTTRPPATPRRAAETSDPATPVNQLADQPENPLANPSPDPSPKAQGEGSGERETGEPDVPSRSKKVGSPARAREAAASAGLAELAPQLEHDLAAAERPSARQRRRTEAERLVDFYGAEVPGRVRAQLAAEVIAMLRDGIATSVISAGLAVWSTKTLPARFLPELVGERMRATRTGAIDATGRERDVRMIEQFEQLRTDAIAEDDQDGVGAIVRHAELRHADAVQIDAVLDAAFGELAAGQAA